MVWEPSPEETRKIKEMLEPQQKDLEFLQKNLGEWYEKHPNHWVVIHNQELIAATDDVIEFLTILWKCGEEKKNILTWFLNTTPMILSTQKVKKLRDLEKSLNDFMKGAVPATEFMAVTKRIQERETDQLIDPVRLKRDQDWSVLGHQVVGAEVL